MNKTLKIILPLVIILLVVYACLVFLCKIGDKCKDCNQTSSSIAESKQDGYFIKDYNISNSIIKLKYYSQKIKIKRIWAEKTWKYNSNCYKIFYDKKSENKGYNVVVEFSKTSDQFLFTFTPIINNLVDKSNGGIEDNRKTMHFDMLPNELKLILEEKNPKENVGWQEGIVSDTITILTNNVR